MNEEALPGDIIRESWPEKLDEHLNLYIGNGRFGACLDAWGLMNSQRLSGNPHGQPTTNKGCPCHTRLMHADHWHRGAWGLDYWLPVGRLCWAGEAPPPPRKYLQQQRLVHGYVQTQMHWQGLELTLISYFHPTRRDLFACHVHYEASGPGSVPDMLLAPETDILTHYDQHLTGTAQALESSNSFWLGQVNVGSAESVLALRVLSNEGRVQLSSDAAGLRLKFGGKRGTHLLLVGVAAGARKAELCEEMRAVKNAQALLDESFEGWQRRWGEGEVDIPDEKYQALFERSHFYTLASYAPEVRSPAAPMGWSGNGWPFHFPQDVSYIHPALLRLGHLDIAKSWVEFYRSRLDNMKEYTARIYKARGAMWAWEFPIGPDSQLLKDGTPNWFQFEIHNAAYPARMAREAALYARDKQWATDIAWPVVRESARFLGSILQRENDGTWGIHVVPSMGQDEMGGQDARNYLCALFSSQYSLQTALAMGAELGLSDPEFEQWRAALHDGLAFPRLFDKEKGIYATCEGLLGAKQVGKQKHPVQLNPLTFLPISEVRSTKGGVRSEDCDAKMQDTLGASVRAYQMRDDLCAGVREKFYHGWTLAAYWLAAAHQRDGAGLLRELENMLPGRYVDKDFIQIYETSGALSMPFYVTSHGLYLQALLDALVSDYWGQTEIGAACPDEWDGAAFDKLHTADGKVLSGEMNESGEWEVEEE
ncbi:MAG TPA: hypothetical protein VGP72_16050 [Planctomycetota bacterium]|jgi:hypothetical protein